VNAAFALTLTQIFLGSHHYRLCSRAQQKEFSSFEAAPLATTPLSPFMTFVPRKACGRPSHLHYENLDDV